MFSIAWVHSSWSRKSGVVGYSRISPKGCHQLFHEMQKIPCDSATFHSRALFILKTASSTLFLANFIGICMVLPPKGGQDTWAMHTHWYHGHKTSPKPQSQHIPFVLIAIQCFYQHSYSISITYKQAYNFANCWLLHLPHLHPSHQPILTMNNSQLVQHIASSKPTVK